VTDASGRRDGEVVERLRDAFLARDACCPKLGDDGSKFSRYLISTRYTDFRSGALSRPGEIASRHGFDSRLTAPTE
jgi:hypothetical protein